MPVEGNSLRSNNNTGVFALVATFFAIQFAFDLAHSVTAFPFVHYGMFSHSFSAPDSLLRYEVIVDGRPLDAADFRIYKWDMIQEPLAAFDNQSLTADFSFDKKKLRAALPAFYSRISANLDNTPTLAADFPDWYRAYLSRLLHQPIHTLRVNRCRYRYKDTRPTLLNTTPWINR